MKMSFRLGVLFFLLLVSKKQIQATMSLISQEQPMSSGVTHNNGDDWYLDLTRDRSNLADVIAEISLWDGDEMSPVWQLHRYIAAGYMVAPKDAVLEALMRAENVIEKKSSQLTYDQFSQINDSLDMLADEINRGSLDAKGCDCTHGPIIKVREKLYVLDRAKFFDCVTFKKCVEFEECIEDLCVNNLVVNNCMNDLCVNNLSVVDEAVSGTLSTCDVFVGCNLFMNDSFNPAIGNVIKNGSRFIHTYPAASNNTFIGSNAGNFSMTGQNNTTLGSNALTANTSGSSNIAVGNSSLESNTEGVRNIAVGMNALSSNTTGRSNTAVGDFALTANIDGQHNVAVGASAMLENIDGIWNTAVGDFALQNNTSGNYNTAIGYSSLDNNITGNNNVGIGLNAWASGEYNVMVGNESGADGSRNVGVGFEVCQSCKANNNVAIGYSSMSNSSSLNGDNTAVGYQTFVNVQGGFNIAIGSGSGSGSTLSSSNNNIYIANAGVNESDAIRIGTLGTHASCFIQGIRGVVTGVADAIPVLIDSTGQLGTVSSSKRFKHDIAAMADDSEMIYQLNPVTFAYNEDASETRQYGLIAEEVERVFPAIVVKDADGQPYTVQYHVLPVLLLNELIKQKAEFAQVIECINSRLAALEQHS